MADNLTLLKWHIRLKPVVFRVLSKETRRFGCDPHCTFALRPLELRDLWPGARVSAAQTVQTSRGQSFHKSKRKLEIPPKVQRVHVSQGNNQEEPATASIGTNWKQVFTDVNVKLQLDFTDKKAAQGYVCTSNTVKNAQIDNMWPIIKTTPCNSTYFQANLLGLAPNSYLALTIPRSRLFKLIRLKHVQSRL